MELPLVQIETALPLHFQRLLLDGIVDVATTATPSPLAPFEARLLHHRWTLRALVRQSQTGSLTASSRSEADELVTGFQAALGDLLASHLTIAKSIQATLLADDKTLSKQAQLDAFVDLGVYFFSFNGYEKAYECFSRAGELVDDFRDVITLVGDDKDALEGYLAACEAVLETRSMGEGDTLAKSPTAQLEVAWDSRDWDAVCRLLEHDMVAYELTRLSPGYRAALEQRALRIVRAQSSAGSGGGRLVRSLYTRVAIGNALFHVVQTDTSLGFETGVCTVTRLLQEDVYYDASVGVSRTTELRDSHNTTNDSSFRATASYTVHLVGFLAANGETRAKPRLELVLKRLIQTFPSLQALDNVQSQLPSGQRATSADVTTLLANETFLRIAADKQRTHMRLASDLTGLFAFERPSDREAVVALVRTEFASLGDNDDNDKPTRLSALLDAASSSGAWKNVVAFCMLHRCWDALVQWKAFAAPKSLVASHVEFASACGALMQYFSSLESTSESSKPEFSILTSNKLVADILLKRRQVLDVLAAAATSRTDGQLVDDADAEAQQLLLDLPLWILETLVCLAAGLLHRAYMRNISDYRISFELTPYGDLAFLQAFAPETLKKRVQGTTTTADSGGDSDAKDADSTSVFLTAPFMKSFQADLVALHSNGLVCLSKRCAREPRWHCARADMSLNPIVKQKLSSSSGA